MTGEAAPQPGPRSPSESVVICEGFHDRSFWQGWLLALGCTDPSNGGRVEIQDPAGKPVRGGGVYGFRSRTGRFIKVIPAQGDRDRILRVARLQVTTRRWAELPLERLVVNVDADLPGVSPEALRAPTRSSVRDLVRGLDGSATEADGDHLLTTSGCPWRLSTVVWQTPDPVDTPGVPRLDTLERVVCAALAAAHPDRGPAVEAWLRSRPNAPPASVKDHAWSYMAGWFSEKHCEAFYQLLWQDPAIRAELESRLRASGAWRVAEALAA